MPNHYLPIPQSSAQNPFRAEDFCSIIIETRPQKGHHRRAQQQTR
jgi:hypothetical protein